MPALQLDNAKVWTGGSFVRSVTVRDGRIERLDGEAPEGARRIDLGGRLVVPGFIDNHLHFVAGSLQLVRVRLRDATSPEELRRRIAERAGALRAGEWVLGGEWDEQRWNPSVLPTRDLIDEDTPHNPVFVTRLDLHLGLANSAALRLAGITRETPDPPGGAIVRGPDGEPTGVLKDAAMNLVTAHVPPVPFHERVEAARRGLGEAARLGVTSFCDMGITPAAFDDLRAWQQLEDEGALTARVWMYLPIEAWASAVEERKAGSARVRVAGLKGFADGSLGSATAAFHEPYEDDPSNRGLMMQPMLDGSMARWVAAADGAELHLALHAIGDRAVAEVMAIYESRPSASDRRFRIEHAQHVDAELIRRIAASGVIAAMQPYHAADDGRWAESKIGSRRAAHAFAFRSLLDAGVLVTFGSDWPVAPLDPVAGIAAAVTRRTLDGRHPAGWIPEQRITVEEALRCYTSNGARAVSAERDVGTIAPGMRADLVVLSHDLFAVPPDEIERTRVEMTIFDGEIIYEG